jgi:hypothetical protein
VAVFVEKVLLFLFLLRVVRVVFVLVVLCRGGVLSLFFLLCVKVKRKERKSFLFCQFLCFLFLEKKKEWEGEREAPPLFFSLSTRKKRKDGTRRDRYRSRSAEIFVRKEKEESNHCRIPRR